MSQKIPSDDLGMRVLDLPRKQLKRLEEAHRGEPEQAALNRLKAFELRARRMTYRQIAEALGVNVKTAHSYVEGYWEEMRPAMQESAEMLRQMELEMLDALEAKWGPLALDPALEVSTTVKAGSGTRKIELPAFEAGLKAVDRVLRIMERRAKLLGLDRPVKAEKPGKVRRHLTLPELEQRLKDAGMDPEGPANSGWGPVPEGGSAASAPAAAELRPEGWRERVGLGTDGT